MLVLYSLTLELQIDATSLYVFCISASSLYSPFDLYNSWLAFNVSKLHILFLFCTLQTILFREHSDINLYGFSICHHCCRLSCFVFSQYALIYMHICRYGYCICIIALFDGSKLYWTWTSTRLLLVPSCFQQIKISDECFNCAFQIFHNFPVVYLINLFSTIFGGIPYHTPHKIFWCDHLKDNYQAQINLLKKW